MTPSEKLKIFRDLKAKGYKGSRTSFLRKLRKEDKKISKFNKQYTNSEHFNQLLTDAGYTDEEKQIRKGLINQFNPKKDISYKEEGLSYAYDEDGDKIDYNITDKGDWPSWSAIQAHEHGHRGISSEGSPMSDWEKEQLTKRNVTEKNPVLYMGQKRLEEGLNVTEDDQKHDLDEQESRADLFQLRYDLNKAGIYDSRKGGEFTPDMLKQYYELEDKGETDWNRLQRLYKDNDILWMMNNIAQETPQNTEGQIPTAAYGGPHDPPYDPPKKRKGYGNTLTVTEKDHPDFLASKDSSELGEFTRLQQVLEKDYPNPLWSPLDYLKAEKDPRHHELSKRAYDLVKNNPRISWQHNRPAPPKYQYKVRGDEDWFPKGHRKIGDIIEDISPYSTIYKQLVESGSEKYLTPYADPNSPDIVHETIKPTSTYWGRGSNKIYASPTTPVIYAPSEEETRKITEENMLKNGESSINEYVKVIANKEDNSKKSTPSKKQLPKRMDFRHDAEIIKTPASQPLSKSKIPQKVPVYRLSKGETRLEEKPVNMGGARQYWDPELGKQVTVPANTSQQYRTTAPKEYKEGGFIETKSPQPIVETGRDVPKFENGGPTDPPNKKKDFYNRPEFTQYNKIIKKIQEQAYKEALQKVNDPFYNYDFDVFNQNKYTQQDELERLYVENIKKSIQNDPRITEMFQSAYATAVKDVMQQANSVSKQNAKKLVQSKSEDNLEKWENYVDASKVNDRILPPDVNLALQEKVTTNALDANQYKNIEGAGGQDFSNVAERINNATSIGTEDYWNYLNENLPDNVVNNLRQDAEIQQKELAENYMGKIADKSITKNQKFIQNRSNPNNATLQKMGWDALVNPFDYAGIGVDPNLRNASNQQIFEAGQAGQRAFNPWNLIPFAGTSSTSVIPKLASIAPEIDMWTHILPSGINAAAHLLTGLSDDAESLRGGMGIETPTGMDYLNLGFTALGAKGVFGKGSKAFKQYQKIKSGADLTSDLTSKVTKPSQYVDPNWASRWASRLKGKKVEKEYGLQKDQFESWIEKNPNASAMDKIYKWNELISEPTFLGNLLPGLKDGAAKFNIGEGSLTLGPKSGVYDANKVTQEIVSKGKNFDIRKQNEGNPFFSPEAMDQITGGKSNYKPIFGDQSKEVFEQAASPASPTQQSIGYKNYMKNLAQGSPIKIDPKLKEKIKNKEIKPPEEEPLVTKGYYKPAWNTGNQDIDQLIQNQIYEFPGLSEEAVVNATRNLMQKYPLKEYQEAQRALENQKGSGIAYEHFINSQLQMQNPEAYFAHPNNNSLVKGLTFPMKNYLRERPYRKQALIDEKGFNQRQGLLNNEYTPEQLSAAGLYNHGFNAPMNNVPGSLYSLNQGPAIFNPMAQKLTGAIGQKSLLEDLTVGRRFNDYLLQPGTVYTYKGTGKGYGINTEPMWISDLKEGMKLRADQPFMSTSKGKGLGDITPQTTALGDQGKTLFGESTMQIGLKPGQNILHYNDPFLSPYNRFVMEREVLLPNTGLLNIKSDYGKGTRGFDIDLTMSPKSTQKSKPTTKNEYNYGNLKSSLVGAGSTGAFLYDYLNDNSDGEGTAAALFGLFGKGKKGKKGSKGKNSSNPYKGMTGFEILQDAQVSTKKIDNLIKKTSKNTKKVTVNGEEFVEVINPFTKEKVQIPTSEYEAGYTEGGTPGIDKVTNKSRNISDNTSIENTGEDLVEVTNPFTGEIIKVPKNDVVEGYETETPIELTEFQKEQAENLKKEKDTWAEKEADLNKEPKNNSFGKGLFNNINAIQGLGLGVGAYELMNNDPEAATQAMLFGLLGKGKKGKPTTKPKTNYIDSSTKFNSTVNNIENNFIKPLSDIIKDKPYLSGDKEFMQKSIDYNLNKTKLLRKTKDWTKDKNIYSDINDKTYFGDGIGIKILEQYNKNKNLDDVPLSDLKEAVEKKMAEIPGNEKTKWSKLLDQQKKLQSFTDNLYRYNKGIKDSEFKIENITKSIEKLKKRKLFEGQQKDIDNMQFDLDNSLDDLAFNIDNKTAINRNINEYKQENVNAAQKIAENIYMHDELSKLGYRVELNNNLNNLHFYAGMGTAGSELHKLMNSHTKQKAFALAWNAKAEKVEWDYDAGQKSIFRHIIDNKIEAPKSEYQYFNLESNPFNLAAIKKYGVKGKNNHGNTDRINILEPIGDHARPFNFQPEIFDNFEIKTAEDIQSLKEYGLLDEDGPFSKIPNVNEYRENHDTAFRFKNKRLKKRNKTNKYAERERDLDLEYYDDASGEWKTLNKNSPTAKTDKKQKRLLPNAWSIPDRFGERKKEIELFSTSNTQLPTKIESPTLKDILSFKGNTVNNENIQKNKQELKELENNLKRFKEDAIKETEDIRNLITETEANIYGKVDPAYLQFATKYPEFTGFLIKNGIIKRFSKNPGAERYITPGESIVDISKLKPEERTAALLKNVETLKNALTNDELINKYKSEWKRSVRGTNPSGGGLTTADNIAQIKGLEDVVGTGQLGPGNYSSNSGITDKLGQVTGENDPDTILSRFAGNKGTYGSIEVVDPILDDLTGLNAIEHMQKMIPHSKNPLPESDYVTIRKNIEADNSIPKEEKKSLIEFTKQLEQNKKSLVDINHTSSGNDTKLNNWIRKKDQSAFLRAGRPEDMEYNYSRGLGNYLLRNYWEGYGMQKDYSYGKEGEVSRASERLLLNKDRIKLTKALKPTNKGRDFDASKLGPGTFSNVNKNLFSYANRKDIKEAIRPIINLEEYSGLTEKIENLESDTKKITAELNRGIDNSEAEIKRIENLLNEYYYKEKIVKKEFREVLFKAGVLGIAGAATYGIISGGSKSGMRGRSREERKKWQSMTLEEKAKARKSRLQKKAIKN